MTTPLDELKRFEELADAQRSRLSILRLPARSLFTMLGCVLFGLNHGVTRNAQKRPHAGSNLATRFGYVVPYLEGWTSLPPSGSAADAIQPFGDAANSAEFAFLTQYAHLAELMPEVHHSYFTVARRSGGFRLDHRSPEFGRFEIRDTMLMELTLPFAELPRSVDAIRYALYRAGPVVTEAGTNLMRELAGLYREHTFEVALMSDDGLRRSIGATYGEYRRFQAALLALADHALLMARAYLHADGEPGDEGMANALNWIAPCMRESDFTDRVALLSDVDVPVVQKLVDLCSLDGRSGGSATKKADGYLPPLLRLPDTIVTLPDLIRDSMQCRNLLYTLNDRDSKHFSTIVHSELEPHLVSQAIACLEHVPGLRMIRSVRFHGKEIDLLVYEAASNTAVQIQAKAPIPAQGGRLTRNLEGNVGTALRQLAEFRVLPAAQRDTILSRALGTTVRDVTLLDCVLCRGGFGTLAVYEGSDDVTFLTLLVLAVVVARSRDAGRTPTLAELLAQSREYIDELENRAEATWRHEVFTLCGTELEIPMFDTNEAFVNEERRRAYQALSSLSANL